MHSPTPRLMAILELLQAHGSLSGGELAERLGVDRRTIRRDVLRLEDMGIPVAAERGAGGGYRLVAGYRLPPMLFTEAEALALSLGLLAARRLGLAEAASGVASAQAKLDRVLPGELKARHRALEATVTLTLGRAPAPEAHPDPGILAALVDAAHRRRRVDLRYQAEGRPATERAFDCYGLVHRGGHWYALGHCHLRREMRTFRLDRVRGVGALGAGFVPPAGFDAAARLVQGIAALPRGIAVEVLLRTDLESARSALTEGFGLLSPREDGVLLHGETADLAWYARRLAGLPFDAEVLGPPALREALHARASALLAASAPRR